MCVLSQTVVQELDIIELEKRYWTLKSSSKSGKFDLETFIPLVSPPIPKCLCKGKYNKLWLLLILESATSANS